MAYWEKRTIRMPENHGWKSKEGYNVFVADRGALRLDIPAGWIVKPDVGSVKFFDREPPTDQCVIEVSHMKLRPIDWSGLSLATLLQGLRRQEGHDLADDEIVRIARPDLELAWMEYRMLDPVELRPAVHRSCLARTANALLPHPRRKGVQILTRPMIQGFITAAFWPENTASFDVIWDDVLSSLQLGIMVPTPFGPNRH